VKDDIFTFSPHLLYHDIHCYSTTLDFPCKNTCLDVSTSDHSQDTLDVNLSLHCGEDTSSSKKLSHLSFVIFEKSKCEHPFFSSTPLHDSSNHEDVDELLNFLTMVVVISLVLHLITMTIHSLLIYLSPWSPMIYLLTMWKPCGLPRHFSLS